MPTVVHRFLAGQRPDFDDYLLPDCEPKLTVLTDLRNKMSKLVLIKCAPEDDRTEVFERDISTPTTEKEMERQSDDFSNNFLPDELAMTVVPRIPYVAMIKSLEGGTPGLVIRHFVYITLC